MHLWISGFLAGDNEDDSLKYSLTVQPDFEQAIMGVLGWDGFDKSPDGEWLLTSEQVREIAAVRLMIRSTSSTENLANDNACTDQDVFLMPGVR
ncbi:pyocin S6 family toxin immunity protein [Pseudomonas sp. MWU12-2037]|uniref:pyocin S6 family toxin immunity protein n=1 Tax=Pseudomonas sp. MWU12-2037 TaxID=2928690 RepID=UPI00200BE264|nr:pyocin S6 family toxin immunity protein [Pseudomonas sp. MWU12-2037]